MALLNNTTQTDSVLAGERIRAQIEQDASSYYNVTASIGVAGDVVRTDIDSPDWSGGQSDEHVEADGQV